MVSRLVAWSICWLVGWLAVAEATFTSMAGKAVAEATSTADEAVAEAARSGGWSVGR